MTRGLASGFMFSKVVAVGVRDGRFLLIIERVKPYLCSHVGKNYIVFTMIHFLVQAESSG